MLVLASVSRRAVRTYITKRGFDYSASFPSSSSQTYNAFNSYVSQKATQHYAHPAINTCTHKLNSLQFRLLVMILKWSSTHPGVEFVCHEKLDQKYLRVPPNIMLNFLQHFKVDSFHNHTLLLSQIEICALYPENRQEH